MAEQYTQHYFWAKGEITPSPQLRAYISWIAEHYLVGSVNQELKARRSQQIFSSKVQGCTRKKEREEVNQEGKDKKEVDDGYYRRDQPITLSDPVTFEAIYELLEKIEKTSQLLYVTDIEMTREFANGYVARKNATFTVSTFYYKGKEDGS